MQLSPATAAAEQASEQSFSPTHGAPAGKALAVGVVLDQALIPLEGVPADITLMVVADQNVPLGPLDPKAAHNPFSAFLDSRLADRPAVRVGAGVNRVGEDVKDRVVDRRFPLQTSAFRSMVDGGQRDPLLPEPKMDLPYALHLGELAEDQGERFVHATVRILLDPVWFATHVANRDRGEELAATGFLFERCVGALTQDGQLHLAHCAFHAEQEPVVGKTGIVDAVLVGDQRPDEAAELQQRVPVASVAGQAGRLDRHHRADPALADRCQQLLEPGAVDARARAAEIVINDADVGPAKMPRPLDQSVLPSTALDVVDYLVDRRLPDVDDRLPGEMVSLDPAHGAPPSRSETRPRAKGLPSRALSHSPASPGDVLSGSVAGVATLRIDPVVGGSDA